MSGAALLALAAAVCFAIALILTQYGLRTMPSWRSPIYSIGGSAILAWVLAAIFVDPAGFNLKAALIFAGVCRANALFVPGDAVGVGDVTPTRCDHLPTHWRQT